MLRNRRLLSLLVSLTLIVGILVGASPQQVFADDTKTITILHLNDIHGRVSPDEREGVIGFAKLKTKVNELRAENPNLLLLNAGDTVHGTTLINVTEGETMINLMNLVGFDAMVPGNHDFNYGYERLLELRDMSEFDMLGANIVNEKTKTPYFDSYVIKKVDGLKVGIFGLGTDETKFKSHPKNTIGVEFLDPVEVSERIVKELKDEGVDIIIALSHLGIEGTTTMTSKEVAEKVEGIDLIVDGHSHEILNKVVGDTLIVQADSYTRNIGRVDLEIKDGKMSKKTASLFTYEEAQKLTPDPAIEAAIKQIEVINAPITEVVVGKTTVKLDGDRGNVRTGETNLGNLITDAMLKSTEADVALTNGGGIRSSIEAGEIKVDDILTAFPFTNTLAVIEATGAELILALERGVDSYPEEAGHFAHVGGMSYTFDPSKAVGKRIKDVLVGEEKLDLGKTYKLVTNDFIADGGDGYTMFKGKIFVGEGGLLSDVLVEYMKAMKEVTPKVEGRMRVIEEVKKPVEVEKPEKVEKPQEVKKPEEIKKPEAAIKRYTVKVDDVLWKIAKSFNTSWQRLAEINNLKNPHLIYPNQILLIK